MECRGRAETQDDVPEHSPRTADLDLHSGRQSLVLPAAVADHHTPEISEVMRKGECIVPSSKADRPENVVEHSGLADAAAQCASDGTVVA